MQAFITGSCMMTNTIETLKKEFLGIELQMKALSKRRIRLLKKLAEKRNHLLKLKEEVRKKLIKEKRAGLELPLRNTEGKGNIPSGTSIDEIEDFSIRIVNCLSSMGCITIDDLCLFTENELSRIPNMGEKSVREIKRALAENGLSLSMGQSSV